MPDKQTCKDTSSSTVLLNLQLWFDPIYSYENVLKLHLASNAAVEHLKFKKCFNIVIYNKQT